VVELTPFIEPGDNRRTAGTGRWKKRRVVALRQRLLVVHHWDCGRLGDIRPMKRASRIIAIVVALLGLTLTGILIAVGVHAATLALAAHDAIEKVR
jgi:hypothetical protein